MADSAHRKHREAAGGFLAWAHVALYPLVQWYPGCHVIEARNLVATFQCSCLPSVALFPSKSEP